VENALDGNIGNDFAYVETPVAATEPATYVAMGDSYSAGEGLGPPAGSPYLPGTDIAEPYRNQCHRHQGAYSQRLAKLWRLPPPRFVACSGAITADYKNPNAESNYRAVGEREHPQKEALSAATKIVTLTFGGNDAGFVKVIETCTYEGYQQVRPNPHCSSAKKHADFRKQTDAAIAAVTGKLASIISDVLVTAPEAHVFVADYPIPFGTFYAGKNPPAACKIGRVDVRNVWKGPIPIRYTDLFVDADDARWINQKAAKLNRAIKAAVATVNSSRVTYVPITGAFAGHRFCDTQAPWLNKVTGSYDGATKEQTLWSGSFHPKAAGQKAYARRFDTAYDSTFGLPPF
jgi:lysophospholipase L1-like esterase